MPLARNGQRDKLTHAGMYGIDESAAVLGNLYGVKADYYARVNFAGLKKIVDAYREVTDYRLIFTKLDETEERGNMFNIRLYTGAEICYVTCGQNVPDDLESFNPQKTVKLLLGGRKDARK